MAQNTVASETQNYELPVRNELEIKQNNLVRLSPVKLKK